MLYLKPALKELTLHTWRAYSSTLRNVSAMTLRLVRLVWGGCLRRRRAARLLERFAKCVCYDTGFSRV